MKSKICLIRHGITEGNKRELYYGNSDLDLAPEGIAGLKKLVRQGIYPDGKGADFYTTGLKRTEQTLQIIYGEQESVRLEQLKEINFGDFEMKTYDQLKHLEKYRTWLKDPGLALAPPNGESVSMFYKRIAAGFEDLKKRHAVKELAMGHTGQDAVSILVCHGGTISAIMESLFPGRTENFYHGYPDFGRGYIFTLESGEIVGVEDL